MVELRGTGVALSGPTISTQQVHGLKVEDFNDRVPCAGSGEGTVLLGVSCPPRLSLTERTERKESIIRALKY
jgi:hypothetical protein